MSLLTDFRANLPDTILVHPVTFDGYGSPIVGTGVPYLGRVVSKTQTSRSATGEEKITTLTVILATTADTNVTATSHLALPNGTVERVFSIAYFRDEKNLHHHTTVTL